jgi:D-amino peptidase
MKFYILTDLEGVAGVDHFHQTRTREIPPKLAGMKQLAKEVHACAEGIRSVYPSADIDVLDGHGPGGLLEEDLVGCKYMRLSPNEKHINFSGYDGLFFVGQHAMAGTVNAPLCHTYSSLAIQYYQLNGLFIGEFASRALVAGMQGVPTLFLSGDDKAAWEALNFVPQIETAITKYGTGLESARHLDSADACRLIRDGAARATRRIDTIPPYQGITAPFVFEARYYEPQDPSSRPEVHWIDERTYRIETSDILKLPF